MMAGNQCAASPIYFEHSAGTAAIFLLLTFLIGNDYTLTERAGGALRVMFLSLTVTMIILIPREKEREKEGYSTASRLYSCVSRERGQPAREIGSVNQNVLP